MTVKPAAPNAVHGGLQSRKTRRRRLLCTIGVIAVLNLAAALLHRDYLGTALTIGISTVLTAAVVLLKPGISARAAYRRRAATGALYAGGALLEEVDRLRTSDSFHMSLDSLHWPWWARSGYRAMNVLPGVLWIVRDDLNSEVGWEPSRMSRSFGAKPWWIDTSHIVEAAVCEATLVLYLDDGTKPSFRTDREGLNESMQQLPIRLVP